jgi:hypothetical protein
LSAQVTPATDTEHIRIVWHDEFRGASLVTSMGRVAWSDSPARFESYVWASTTLSVLPDPFSQWIDLDGHPFKIDNTRAQPSRARLGITFIEGHREFQQM